MADAAWLEPTGVGVSIVFLFGLAFANLRAVLLTDPTAVVAPVGIRSRLLGRFVTVRRPWAVTAVGVLFALSFDTISQATLFAVAAGHFGGVAEALLVAGLFVLGMLRSTASTASGSAASSDVPTARPRSRRA